MTNEQLKELENNLWDSANSLRAYGGMKAADYAIPVLGLIFLRFAENKYSLYEADIISEFEKNKGTRMETPIHKIAIAKCGFYLPDNARYNYLLHLESEKSLAEALRDAMKGIEEYQDEKFKDVLPTETYFSIEKKKKDILPQLLRNFSDIPKDASGDIFGKIYEYFLGKFSLSEGQKGGEFFTPTSVVRFIVEVIEPYKGKIYDPACGSGGMFVQSANFIKHENHALNDIYVCGQENTGETVRLAKMNLLINNIRGEIKEVNSYESDPFKGLGKFDFVMANPPFNVKSVKEATVKDDKRFNFYGLPKNKGKKDDKITDANYLWISLFATSLNKNGRAGFVMPNSASDARNSEYEIRKKIIDSGIVDCMVSMPSNMFFTVTLPATLWFFDKQKVNTERKDKILFLDARNVYHQIDRAHREWTEENQQNLAIIVRLYHGKTEQYLELIKEYITNCNDKILKVTSKKNILKTALNNILENLRAYCETAQKKLTAAKKKVLIENDFFEKLESFEFTKTKMPALPVGLEKEYLTNEEQLKFAEEIAIYLKLLKIEADAIRSDANTLVDLWKLADKSLKLKADKNWSSSILNRADKNIEEVQKGYFDIKEDVEYWHNNIHWLQSRFPKAEYKDIIGLCKVADKTEYADEQDYSLNAGRYVGIEIDDDNTKPEEFKEHILVKNKELEELTKIASNLEDEIKKNINRLFL